MAPQCHLGEWQWARSSCCEDIFYNLSEVEMHNYTFGSESCQKRNSLIQKSIYIMLTVQNCMFLSPIKIGFQSKLIM